MSQRRVTNSLKAEYPPWELPCYGSAQCSAGWCIMGSTTQVWWRPGSLSNPSSAIPAQVTLGKF